MNNLGDYLQKFTKLIGSTKFQKEAVISTVKTITGVELTDKDIDIKDSAIYIKASPAAKSAIFIKKQKIITELERYFDKQVPKNIR